MCPERTNKPSKTRGPYATVLETPLYTVGTALQPSAFNRLYWSAAVKRANFDHPEEELKKLIKKMWDVKAWLTSKGEFMACGAWLTNRLKECR